MTKVQPTSAALFLGLSVLAALLLAAAAGRLTFARAGVRAVGFGGAGGLSGFLAAASGWEAFASHDRLGLFGPKPSAVDGSAEDGHVLDDDVHRIAERDGVARAHADHLQ